MSGVPRPSHWKERLFPTKPVDPWGSKYLYRSPGEHGEYDLFSYGKDGKPGGTDEAADITNW